MNGHFVVDGKNYSREILKLITGDQGIGSKLETIPKRSLVLCEVLDNPYKLPYYLEYFYSMEMNFDDPFHFSLLRVQVDSELRLTEDIQKHQQRLYVAKTIEKLMFGELLLEAIEAMGLGDLMGA